MVPKENVRLPARRLLFGRLAPLAKAEIFPRSLVKITSRRSYSAMGIEESTIPVTVIRSLIFAPVPVIL